MRNEALQWWDNLDEDSKIEVATRYYPGVNIGMMLADHIEKIYLQLYYPEGIE